MTETISPRGDEHIDSDWRHRGACLDEDPDLFFQDEKRRNHKDVVAAIAICIGCEVRVDCLNWALETRQKHSIAGGFTDKERSAMLRKIDKGKMILEHALSIQPKAVEAVNDTISSNDRTRLLQGHRLDIVQFLDDKSRWGELNDKELTILRDYANGASHATLKVRYGFGSTAEFGDYLKSICSKAGFPILY